MLGIDSLDTRALTRHIRTAGAMRAVISTQTLDPAALVERAKQAPKMEGRDLVRTVATDQPYFWDNDRPVPVAPGLTLDADLWCHRGTRPSVAAFDFGVKYNILRCLERAGCEVLVMPAATSAANRPEIKPGRHFFYPTVRATRSRWSMRCKPSGNCWDIKPMFGICLGIQLLGLSLGGRTYKLKFGHHGANQPVQNLKPGGWR